ncbi:MAG: hypothetical protein ACRDXB_19455 [Actinomycetes bacterium]
MDGRDWPGGTRTPLPALPALPPNTWYSGEDGSGRVRVEIDDAARGVAVVVEDGWRTAPTAEGLAGAVLEAFSAAINARLTAWAASPPADLATDEQARPPAAPATDVTLTSLSRAWRDLREFQHRLTTLHAATETVPGPGRPAVATIAGGQLVRLDLDPEWLRTATAQDLERHIAHALRAALDRIATLPERALEGCPDLQSLLSTTGFSPFGPRLRERNT